MLCNPPQAGIIAALLAAIGLLRGRPRLSLAVIALLGATSVSSQLLKALLAYPRYDGVVDGAHVDPAAFPSGHATAAMSLALAARARGAAARQAASRPCWAWRSSLTIAFCDRHPRLALPERRGRRLPARHRLGAGDRGRAPLANERWPEHAGRTRVTAALQRAVDGVATLGIAALALLLVAGVAFVAVTLLLTRPSDLVDFADEHTALVAVGGGIAFAAAVLLGGVTAALRRS